MTRAADLLLAVALTLTLSGCAGTAPKPQRGDRPAEYRYVRGDPEQSLLQPGVSPQDIGSIDASGAPGPQEAARRYIVSIASDRPARFEEVTGRKPAVGELERLRLELLGSSSPVDVNDVFSLDLIAQDGDTFLYHLFVGLPSGRLVGVDVRVLHAREGQWGALDAASWRLTSADQDRAGAELERRRETDSLRW